ncbi:MAG: FHA domain-containing protein [Algiphilus sp.]
MPLRIDIIRDGGSAETVESKGTVALGRGEDATVVLPGMAVARHHAEIALESESALRLRCRSPLGVEVNGEIIKDEKVLYAGDVFRIGAHRGEVTLSPDHEALMLRLELVSEPAIGDTSERRLDLSAAGLRIRRSAYVAALLVLLLALLVPLVMRSISAPPMVEAVLPSDEWWSSGVLSNGHQHFAGDCSACHERLFVRVQNSACLDCHQGIAHHSDQAQLVGLGEMDRQRCASCHREHGDAHAVLPQRPHTCIDCHAAPQDFPGVADMLAVDAFDTHPGFRATVTRIDGDTRRLERVAIQDGPQDNAGLFFPHDLHLEAEGVRGPDGVEHLVCADCHHPDAGNVGFRALVFERDCESCHRLDVAVGDRLLALPHAQPEVVRRQLSDAVESLPSAAFQPDLEDVVRRRAGPTADRGGAPSPQALIEEVFSTRVCAKCHAVQPDAGDRVEVLPAQLRQSWFVHARFTHADHGWVRCRDCHAAEASGEATDLLLPDIATCRTCHSGVESDSGVRSSCTDCHGFHTAGHSVLGSTQGVVNNGESFAEGR